MDKTVKSITGQEVFNQIYNGLKAQDFKRSVSLDKYSSNDCKYRGDDGRKCAIGQLIPDDKYRPPMETMYVFEIFAEVGRQYLPHMVLIAEAQLIHDVSLSPWDMQRDLVGLARRRGYQIL